MLNELANVFRCQDENHVLKGLVIWNNIEKEYRSFSWYCFCLAYLISPDVTHLQIDYYIVYLSIFITYSARKVN